MLPYQTLLAEHWELGLVAAVLLGFGFGFVLERAGFGRAPKLAAQFYLHDMTVFKVMFTAIVTAMLGVMIAAGFGLVDLRELSTSAVSGTFLWPHLVGGLLLGVGFIVSGYCPGTSVVASASGNIDGMFTVGGVVVGSLLYGEIQPLVATFHDSGSQGHLFLYDLLGVSPQLLAAGVCVMAVLMFIGAEKVEKIFSRKRGLEPSSQKAIARPRRIAFSTLGGLTALTLIALLVPVSTQAGATRTLPLIEQEQLARRLLDEPWKLRILDLRQRAACVKQRIPGAECTPAADVSKLGLPYASGARDLVLVGAETVEHAPADTLAYRGAAYVLHGGFSGWKAYALTRPEPPSAQASAEAKQAYALRAGLHAAVTGRKPAPPPAASTKYVPKPRKKKGGGCS